jgi:hypothetical protein
MAILLPLVAAASIMLRGWSTTYFPGDATGTGSHLACVGAARRILGRTTLRASDFVIATRGKRRPFACGQRVTVRHVKSGRSVYAHKLDTGPWSCYAPGFARLVALVCPAGWHRRSIADLTPAVARAIGHDGFDLVEIR